MRKMLLLLLAIWSSISLSAQTIDYTGYHLVYSDDFTSYADPAGPFPATTFLTDPGSPYYHAFAKNWTTSKGTWGEPYDFFSPMNVSMSKYGTMQLTSKPDLSHFTTDTKGNKMYSHTSGALTTINAYAYGIIEATMKLAPGNPPPAVLNSPDPVSSAFWSNPYGASPTEIDILDGCFSSWLVDRIVDWTYTSPNQHQYSFSGFGTVDYSTSFHLFSCKWDPSGVFYYIDGSLVNTINYGDNRNYPALATWTIAAGCTPYTQYPGAMYVTSFKVYRPDCNTVSATTSDMVYTYPWITSGLYKYSIIDLSNTGGVSYPNPNGAVIIESDATSINANFIADQSTLNSFTDTDPHLYPTGGVTQITNGFFEILPIACGNDVPGSTYNTNYLHTNTGATKYSNVFGNNNNLQLSSNSTGTPANDANGSSSAANVPLSLGNSQAQLVPGISVYPNPAQKNVMVTTTSSSNGQLEITIKDIAGSVVYSVSVPCTNGISQCNIDISTWAAGVYFVDILSVDEHVVKKLVKL